MTDPSSTTISKPPCCCDELYKNKRFGWICLVIEKSSFAQHYSRKDRERQKYAI